MVYSDKKRGFHRKTPTPFQAAGNKKGSLKSCLKQKKPPKGSLKTKIIKLLLAI
jgi:hypothetical protein